MPNNRELIELYMLGNGIGKAVASYYLAKRGGWMFEDGAAKEHNIKTKDK